MDEGQVRRVERAMQGDTEAFGELVAAYKAAMQAYIVSRVRDFDWAQDLAQETFVAAYRALPNLREPRRFVPWLRGIADNLCALWARRLHTERRANEQSLTAPRRSDSEPEPAPRAGEPDQPAPTEPLLHALSTVGDDAAAVLTLYYCDGLTQEQCGEFLGLSRKAVEGRLHRARHKLRQKVIEMTENTLKSHAPDDRFDAAVASEIARLVETVGGGGKSAPRESAEQRLAVLFSRNLDRLDELLRSMRTETDRLAAERMIRRLDTPGAARALSIALGDDATAARNALAALPANDGGKDVYLALDTVLGSQWSEPQRISLLVDLVRRADLLRGQCPKHVLKAFILDALHYARGLMGTPLPAAQRIARVLTDSDQEQAGPCLSHTVAAFGTAAFAAFLPWFDGTDPRLTVLGLELAEALGAAAAELDDPHQRAKWDLAPEDKLLLAVQRVVHPRRVDPEAMRDIGRRVRGLLGHADERVRLAATAALGPTDDDLAVAPLSRLALGEADTRIAATAARALGSRLHTDRIEPLVRVLCTAAPAARRAAAESLLRLRMAAFDAGWRHGCSRLHADDAGDTGDVGAAGSAGDLEDTGNAGRANGAANTAAPVQPHPLADLVTALDAHRERIVLAAKDAGLTAIAQAWGEPLSQAIERSVRSEQRRIEASPKTQFAHRARAHHSAHPHATVRCAVHLFVKGEHACGVACGLLPEDHPYRETELSRLILPVGMDPAHTRRNLVDYGWMARERSVYRLTEIGRRTWRVEHALETACRSSLP